MVPTDEIIVKHNLNLDLENKVLLFICDLVYSKEFDDSVVLKIIEKVQEICQCSHIN